MALYNLIHVLLFPRLPELIDRVPLSAQRLVDLGCGAGIISLLAAMSYPEMEVIGIDLQPARIAAARKAADFLGLDNTQFYCRDVIRSDFPEADVFLISDLLLYLPREEQNKLMSRACSKLSRPGTLIIKDHDKKPLWKNQFLMWEENLGKHLRKVLHAETDQSYFGGQLFLGPAGVREQELMDLGMDVEVIRIDRSSLLPHVVFFATV